MNKKLKDKTNKHNTYFQELATGLKSKTHIKL
jgi:hypothetical protein